jgi:hypothetical protein
VRFLNATTRTGHRAVASAATLAMATVGLAALSPAAQAATPHATTAVGHAALRESFTIPAGRANYTATVDGAHVAVLRNGKVSPEITCTITADLPYLLDGYVQGYAYVTCTGEVYEIVLEAALFYDAPSGWVEESDIYNYQFNTYNAFALTTAPVIAGYWQTAAVADVYWTTPSSGVQLGPADSASYYIS